MEENSEHLKVAVRIRPLLQIDKSDEGPISTDGVKNN